jgi:Major Facilitator Superfamily.
MINTIVGGLGSVIGFAVGGIIAGKIGRKWTIAGGLVLALLSVATWLILGYAIPVATPGESGYNSFPVYLYVIWGLKGFGMSLVHINSFPMVVELSSRKTVGRFTGYYYASSMAAQTITPCLLGLFLLSPSFGFEFLPLYASACLIISLAIFLFVKNIKKKLVNNDVKEVK